MNEDFKLTGKNLEYAQAGRWYVGENSEGATIINGLFESRDAARQAKNAIYYALGEKEGTGVEGWAFLDCNGPDDRTIWSEGDTLVTKISDLLRDNGIAVGEKTPEITTEIRERSENSIDGIINPSPPKAHTVRPQVKPATPEAQKPMVDRYAQSMDSRKDMRQEDARQKGLDRQRQRFRESDPSDPNYKGPNR